MHESLQLCRQQHTLPTYQRLLVCHSSALQMTVAKGDSSASFNRSGALHGLGNQSSAREAREAERRIKLQHFLVLRAFNLRRPKETLHEQFQSLRKRVERSDPKQCGDFLELDELCAYLSIPPYRRLLLVQVFGLGPKETQLGFDDFVRFLQSAAVRAAQEERQRHEGACLLLHLDRPGHSSSAKHLSPSTPPAHIMQLHELLRLLVSGRSAKLPSRSESPSTPRSTKRANRSDSWRRSGTKRRSCTWSHWTASLLTVRSRSSSKRSI